MHRSVRSHDSMIELQADCGTMKKTNSRKSAKAKAPREVGIGLVGAGFMGRIHANAWRQAPLFFNLKSPPTLTSVASGHAKESNEFAAKWGVSKASPTWERLIKDPKVALVDVCVPNYLHAAVSIEVLKAGKHVACEKPLANTITEARDMALAALGAKKGVRTFVWFNYRRCPAVSLMRELIQQGRLGRIRHIRAQYLQDWGRASTPHSWRFDGALAGSGAHGDLNAHIVDMARFVTGDEIDQVCGAMEAQFIQERAVVTASSKNLGLGAQKSKRGAKQQASTVDDAFLFLARMHNGAVASFEASRMATGNKNANRMEVNGEFGSVKFDFERMNELQWWDDTLPAREQGWSRILCTDPTHPYAGHFWPPGHVLGYEHGFISMAADICAVLAGGEPEQPLADFVDAYRTQQVLEAAIISAREQCWIRTDTI